MAKTRSFASNASAPPLAGPCAGSCSPRLQLPVGSAAGQRPTSWQRPGPRPTAHTRSHAPETKHSAALMQTHLPGYIQLADDFKSAGVDEVICTAVNDPFVFTEWGKSSGADGKITMLADTQMGARLGARATCCSCLGNIATLAVEQMVACTHWAHLRTGGRHAS
jgi:hypothetical protein